TRAMRSSIAMTAAASTTGRGAAACLTAALTTAGRLGAGEAFVAGRLLATFAAFLTTFLAAFLATGRGLPVLAICFASFFFAPLFWAADFFLAAISVSPLKMVQL